MSYWTIKLAFHIYTSVMYHSHQLNTQHVIVIVFPGKTPSLLTIKVGIEQLKTNDEKKTFLCWFCSQGLMVAIIQCLIKKT